MEPETSSSVSPAEGDARSESSDVSVMAPQPLTTEDKRRILDLLTLYGHFWTSEHAREGVTKLPFSQEEVHDLLELAAEYVVRIRKHLDQKSAERQGNPRLALGTAEEFLWSVDFVPSQDSRRFVTGLVHATFKDSQGYVEGLTGDILNEYIAELDDYFSGLPNHHSRHPARCRSGAEPPVKDQVAGQHSQVPARLLPRSTTDWSKSVADLLAKAQASLAKMTPEVVGAQENTQLWVNVCKLLETVDRNLELIGGADVEPVTPGTAFTTRSLPEGVDATHGLSRMHTRRALRSAGRRKKGKKGRKHHHKEACASDGSPQPSVPPSGDPAHLEGAPESGEQHRAHEEEVIVMKPVEGDVEMAPAAEPAGDKEKDKKSFEEEGPRSALEEAGSAPHPVESGSGEATEEMETDPAETSTAGAPPVQSEVEIQVGKVDENVQRIQGEVKGLVEECQGLSLDSLVAQQSPSGAAQALEKLQHRALVSSELLMRDLLRLDALVCANPQEQAKRKQAVRAIQSILDDVDRVSDQLRALRQTLPREEPEHTPEPASPSPSTPTPVPAPQEASGTTPPAPSPSPARAEAPGPARSESSSQMDMAVAEAAPVDPRPLAWAKLQELRQLFLDDNSWRGLRLEPNFSVSQQRDRFVLQAYIPNMDRREISVDLSNDGSTLVIQGFRKPSREEAEALLQQLARALAEGRVDIQKFLAQPHEEALLALGKGRFGSFVAQYRLPPRGVARERIQASYHNGALTVTVPIQQQAEVDPFGLPFGAGRYSEGFPMSSLFGGLPW